MHDPALTYIARALWPERKGKAICFGVLSAGIVGVHLTFTAVFEPAEEGGAVVIFSAIPNLATQGEALDEARAMAEDCLRCYLEALAAHGRPLPEGEAACEAFREAITVGLEAA